jgi:hemoglobin
MRSFLLLAVCFVVPVFSVAACGSKKPRVVEPTPVEVSDAGPDVVEAAAPKSLFERVGGKKGVEEIVDSFVLNLAAEPTLKAIGKLQKAKLDAYKAGWVNVLCKGAGGDCAATGTELKELHKGMKLTDKQWESFVTDFTAALGEHKCEDAEKADMLAIFAPFKDEVIEVKAPPAKK